MCNATEHRRLLFYSFQNGGGKNWHYLNDSISIYFLFKMVVPYAREP